MGRTGSGKASFHAKKRKANRGDSDSDSSSDEDRLKPKLKTSHVAAVEKTTSFTVKSCQIIVDWNLMARSMNVDGISFQNFWANGDSVIFKYNTRKGANTTEKHCYANSENPFICLFLALGCYLRIFQQKFDRDCNKVFRAQSQKEKSASSSFSKALKKMLMSIKDSALKLQEFSIRDGHFHPHGVRKGSASANSIGFVARRVEYGKVLEVYWRFSMIGDTYLGRCLAGLMPEKPNFGILPPHFTAGRENPFIEEGMKRCFGVILRRYGGFGVEGALLLFLASIVYHHEWLKTQIAGTTDHPFLQIPILNDPKLLEELKKLVTLDPAGAVTMATGVPESVKLRDKLREVIGLLTEYRNDVKWLKENLTEMVKNAMEEKATENGNITATFVAEQVAAATSKLAAPDGARLTASIGARASRSVGVDDNLPASSSRELGGLEAHLYRTYKYHDPDAAARNRHKSDWDVPSDFTMPSAHLFNGWVGWLQDGSGKKIDAPVPVKPLRLLKHGSLPRKIRRAYDNNWKPIMELMENEVADEIRNRHVDGMNYDFFKSTYDEAFKGVCEKYPEFADTAKTKNWKVPTYCKKIATVKSQRKKAMV
ncbi:hypothetical protein QTG54_014336 [Skeletonema marinoi]|uniref:Uncharacterized protein n=1 Tax=Skeletonema marinoi TaxID=267567 RepID=A0AAD9D5K2_9STRA|nr:hypothetical protein QTG54_014336 [Skeletonema marinoi]